MRPTDHGLMMHMLYYPNEVNRIPEWDALQDAPISSANMKLAKQLVESLAGDFNPEQYENGYDMRLNQLIASKLNKAIAAPQPTKAAAATVLPDLTAALMASMMKPRRTIEVGKPKRKKAA